MQCFSSPTPGGRRRTPRRAFTLIETSVAMVIVTVAITAMCELLAAGTNANVAGNELTTAVNLANTIHEIARAPLNADADGVVARIRQNLWDERGHIFSPAIDGRGSPLADFPNWQQRVTIEPVDESDICAASHTPRATPTARLRVSIYHDGRPIHSASWLIINPDTH